MLCKKISKLPCMGTFAGRLKEALDGKGWNPSDLAREIGISPSAVYQYLSGDSKDMRPENLFKAADKLEVHARWLGTGDGPKALELSRTINAETLKVAITDVEKAIQKTSGKPTLEKKCELIATLYEMYISGEKPSNVVRLVQLVSQNSGPLI
jgi:transcriptional regulator with XRE-family HTH domain